MPMLVAFNFKYEEANKGRWKTYEFHGATERNVAQFSISETPCSQ